jgi:23S rRNA (guanine745-N1)-methyltransferase
VHDRSVDLLASIFAPKNVTEMARVLRPGGWLLLVFPGAGHLQELRAFGLLGSAADKAEFYRPRLMGNFRETAQQRIVQRITLERNGVMDAMLMGPSARHLARIEADRLPGHVAVTIDLVLLLARRR